MRTDYVVDIEDGLIEFNVTLAYSLRPETRPTRECPGECAAAEDIRCVAINSVALRAPGRKRQVLLGEVLWRGGNNPWFGVIDQWIEDHYGQIESDLFEEENGKYEAAMEARAEARREQMMEGGAA